MLAIKLDRILIEKIWGGRNLENLGIKLPEAKNYGESWEVAAHKSHTNFLSKEIFSSLYSRDEKELIEYKFRYVELMEYNLHKLLEKYKGKLVGEEVYEKYQNRFPLLIKYLDINDKLSIQVHPNNEYALKNENDLGKTECWYIMDASGDAELILGLKDGITKEEFINKTSKNDFSNIFNKVKVKKGDFLFIDNGLVHASLRGSIVICEVQQNSDATYRIYDFDRLENGKKRDLHLEKAYDVINFEETYKTRSEYKIIEEKGLWEKKEFVDCEYFKVEYIKIFKEYKEEAFKNFQVLSFLEGHGQLFISDNTFLEVKKGDTYLIPANYNYAIKGELEILKSTIS